MSSLSSPLGRAHLADPRSTPALLALDRLPTFATISKFFTFSLRSSKPKAAPLDKDSIRLIAGSATSGLRSQATTEWGVRATLPTYEDSVVSPGSATASAPSSSISRAS